jgi:hypothetical protein
MPIYIEHIETGKLYGKTGSWVSDAEKALDFLTVSLAQRLIGSLRLTGARIVEDDNRGNRIAHSSD